MNGRELLRAAWWRPLPGIIGTAVLFTFLLNPLAGIVIALASWAVALVFSVALIRVGTSYRRRPWT
jgi:uncharacterized membrane protein HdeD (DUF308 family)